MKNKIIIFRFSFKGDFSLGLESVKVFRDKFAGRFPPGSVCHNHGQTGLLYQYPLVQYVWKAVDRAEVVIVGGIGSPGDWMPDPGIFCAEFGGYKLIDMNFGDEYIGETQGLQTYSCWNLVLGDKAVARIRRDKSVEAAELKKALETSIRRLYSLCGIDVAADDLVGIVSFKRMRPQKFKGITLSPYKVKFQTYAQLPLSLGHGARASHGYGRLRTKGQKTEEMAEA